MAAESFEDEETADLLNNNYISVKVDREERPDIDAVYMKVCQALTGQGGWPLNVFLTPDQKPFYAGTYFPKKSAYGRPGFKDVLLSLKEQYNRNHEKMAEMGTEIVTALSQRTKSQSTLQEETIHQAFQNLSQSFDKVCGGFGRAPKFPAPHQLMFLLRYAKWTGNSHATEMVKKTLDGMAEGGIHDHIGGGFARYSTDEQWLIPHFEKMLYDQAMLALAYTEAYQVTKDEAYKQTIEDIFSYCERELLSTEGGFFCAEDADSEGEEGKYYLWSKTEILSLLGKQEGEAFCEAYRITSAGNFAGRNIPNRIGVNRTRTGQNPDVLSEQFKHAKEILLKARNQRVHPGKDDKMLTSWNALMIVALAYAGKTLHKKHYVNMAETVYRFIKIKLMNEGKLFARFREGEAKFSAYLDDYAFLALSCEALYEATFHAGYLSDMKELADQMIRLFFDHAGRAFRMASTEAEQLVLQPEEAVDSAIPSGNSAAVWVLLKLAERTGSDHYEKLAQQVFTSFSDEISTYPAGYTSMLSALIYQVSGPKELIVLQGNKGEDTRKALDRLFESFLPELTVFSGDLQQLTDFNHNLDIYSTISDRTTYFYCEQFACHLPVTKLSDLLAQLHV
ncbi:thioredoxin domain-containing protein [Sporolactobacillus sp. Y61]|uniref:Thioredoxin domain-containing protein n=1 Tax=Sporolactobacillus sp. Y61 TaxID=3160863 RepID=A0AAU8ICS9_9BACL